MFTLIFVLGMFMFILYDYSPEIFISVLNDLWIWGLDNPELAILSIAFVVSLIILEVVFKVALKGSSKKNK